MGFFASLFAREKPALLEASARDALPIAALHAKSFARGWSEQEVEALLTDRHVITHRAIASGKLWGFIMSRRTTDEAEILSVAVAREQQGKGLAQSLLTVHLGRLMAMGVRVVYLEVNENNQPAIRLYNRAGFRKVGARPNYYPGPNGQPATALVLRRDL